MNKALDLIDKIISKSRVDKYSVSNMSAIKAFLGKRGFEFNCWGASCLYYKIIDSPRWVSDIDMNNVIEEHFNRIPAKEAKINDMVAFYCNGYLIHTAVMVGKDRFFHKIGRNLCTVDSLDQIKVIYSEYNEIRYYRFVDGE